MRDPVSDVDIRLSVAGETLFAEVSCPLGEGFGTRAWPSHAELARSGRELGEVLYDCLFPAGAVRSRYEACRGAIADGGRLRVRIRAAVRASAEEVARIHAVPWELVHAPGGDGFLALDPQIQLVRYLNLPVAVSDPLGPRAGALTVLVAIACPAEYRRLDWAHERDTIERAFADTGVRVTVLPHATRAGLRDLLATEQYEVLHFIGHGGGPTGGRAGMIVLETAHGSADWLTADELAVIARGAGSLRLVFLNACSTAGLAEATHRDLAGSVGPALALAGVPAVVAMASQVLDADAIELARAPLLCRRKIEIDRIALAMNPRERDQFDDDLFLREDHAANQPLLERVVHAPLEPGDVLFFHCLTILPIAEATVLIFCAPLMIAPLAWWILGEKMQPMASIALVIGFIGVLILAGPQFAGGNIGFIFAGAAVIFAAPCVTSDFGLSVSFAWDCRLAPLSMSQPRNAIPAPKQIRYRRQPRH